MFGCGLILRWWIFNQLIFGCWIFENINVGFWILKPSYLKLNFGCFTISFWDVKLFENYFGMSRCEDTVEPLLSEPHLSENPPLSETTIWFPNFQNMVIFNLFYPKTPQIGNIDHFPCNFEQQMYFDIRKYNLCNE